MHAWKYPHKARGAMQRFVRSSIPRVFKRASPESITSIAPVAALINHTHLSTRQVMPELPCTLIHPEEPRSGKLQGSQRSSTCTDTGRSL